MTDPSAPRYEHPQQQAHPQSSAGGSQQYRPQQYGSYEPLPPRGLSITSLVLGVVSLVAWISVLVPVAGLVIGFVALKREPAGRGLAIAGIVLNGLFVVVALLAIIALVLLSIGLVGVLPLFLQEASTGLSA